VPDLRKLIFVNYRGSDQNWATELVYARTTEAFGADAVFKAGNSIRASEEFPPILRRQAASCPVMLACMGPGWLTAARAGSRDLDAPEDWVRQEIALSLQARNHVIPLLIGNHDEMAMPAPEDLPEDIRPMAYRQAWRLAPGSGLDLTVPRLIDRLAELVPELAERRIRNRQAPPSAPIAAPAEHSAALLAAAMGTERWADVLIAARKLFTSVEPVRAAGLIEQLTRDQNTVIDTPVAERERMSERIALRWEGRLEELLARHPAMNDQLQALISHLRNTVARPEDTRTVLNYQHVDANGGNAFGAQNGDVKYYAAPPQSTAAGEPAT
jgi:hypothetical protein